MCGGNIHSSSTHGCCCPSTCIAFGPCRPVTPIIPSVGGCSRRVFQTGAPNIRAFRMDQPIQGQTPREHPLAKAILGTSDTRSERFQPACALYPLESGQARVRCTRDRLALFHVPPRCSGGHISGRLGRRSGTDVYPRGFRRVRRYFPSTRRDVGWASPTVRGAVWM